MSLKPGTHGLNISQLKQKLACIRPVYISLSDRSRLNSQLLSNRHTGKPVADLHPISAGSQRLGAVTGVCFLAGGGSLPVKNTIAQWGDRCTNNHIVQQARWVEQKKKP